jgi:hypothetical protein
MYELYEFVPYNLYMYEFVLYNLYKKRTNYIIRIGMYEFILVNLYKKFIEKKDLHPVGISTRDQHPRLKSSRSTVHHPTPSVSGHFSYIP